MRKRRTEGKRSGGSNLGEILNGGRGNSVRRQPPYFTSGNGGKIFPGGMPFKQESNPD